MKEIESIAILTFGFAAGLAASAVFRHWRKSQSDAIKFDLFVSDPDGNFKLRGKIKDMELREGFKQRVKVGNFRTARGNAASIEAGSGRWTSSDESVVTATVDPNDETQAILESVDGSANESVVVEFKADGRPGEGVKEVIAAFPVTATQGDVAVAEVEPVGTPFEGDEPSTGEPTPPTEPAEPTEPTLPDENPPTEDPGPPNPSEDPVT